ncbi:hypothetical protein DEU56DRAFT_451297 [Suillus clintonianus]|uniref:uncharacterized protein n=1 Tax=Suillus clintonianus TaxID=1904413 RepID=UPI001B8814F4|nr:uncharacterized protein DEU56DRAFT_451297 [Suillus clintonianus]KAG2131791.1 hypothetical protein DEU56DRAFT_451297 [Suillus clintonianus]
MIPPFRTFNFCFSRLVMIAFVAARNVLSNEILMPVQHSRYSSDSLSRVADTNSWKISLTMSCEIGLALYSFTS